MTDPKSARRTASENSDPTAATNPLYRPQREKAGAVTHDRFEFQYNWALFEFLELHKHKKASIVFVELHEDVVFSNSVSAEDASFVFCQVKAGNGSAYTAKSLVRRVKKDKSSVLGKMFTSIADKAIDERVEKVRLVATSGFSLDLADEGFHLEEIPWSAISTETASKIKAALKLELESDFSIEKLHFHEPKLANLQHDLTVVGLIAKLISERVPQEGGNCHAIYLALQDELRRKGAVTWDYSDWDSLVKNKGLTAQRVDALFEQFSSSKSSDQLLDDFDEQTKELGYLTRERRLLRQAARAYVLDTIAGGSLAHVQAQRAICEHLSADFPSELSLAVATALIRAAPPLARDALFDDTSLTAAYLIEYLRA